MKSTAVYLEIPTRIRRAFKNKRLFLDKITELPPLSG